jgi:hypothetical protein
MLLLWVDGCAGACLADTGWVHWDRETSPCSQHGERDEKHRRRDDVHSLGSYLRGIKAGQVC